MNVVVDICNSAAARAQRMEEVNELYEQVDDWKGHKLDRFGELILSGQHTVLKDDTAKSTKERDVSFF
jgi:cell division control protein 24